MSDSSKDQEISLVDLFAVLWKRKWLIIIFTGLAMVFAVVYSILTIKLPVEKSPLPNLYTPRAQMLINNDSSSGGLSGMLSSSGLGGLASMAGVNVKGGASNSSLAKYLVHSDKTLDDVVQQFDMIEKYKIEKYVKSESRKILKQKLSCVYDEDTGVFTIAFTDKDPEFAVEVVNYVVKILERRFEEIGIDKTLLSKKNLEENIDTTYKNIQDLQKQIMGIESSVSNVYSSAGTQSIMMDTSMVKMELQVQENIYSQLKAQYEMLKVSMASEKPVFQILEYAEIPDQKSGPSRGKLCIIITFVSIFLSVFMCFLLNALENIKSNPEVLDKFKK